MIWREMKGWSYDPPVEAPDYVQELLAVLFPTVKLAFYRPMRQWVILDQDRTGRYSPVCRMVTTPNLNNTINYLAKHHISRIMQRSGVDGFLDEVDSHQEKAEKENRDQAVARIHEGSERAAAILAADRVVSFQGSDRHAKSAYRKETGH